MFTFEKDLEVYSLWKAVSEWGVPFVGYLIHCQRTQYCLMNPSGCGKEAKIRFAVILTVPTQQI